MTTTSIQLNENEIEKLKKLASTRKLKKTKISSEYELLRIRDGDISLILYTSGKVVHNGSENSIQLLNSIFNKEKDFDFILGSDETGKGEWYGPLVVVATALTPEDILELKMLGIKDSKKIKKTQILKFAESLKKKDFERYSIILNPETYNEFYSKLQKEGKNLNDMMAWSHSVVINELIKKLDFKKAKVVIDKFDFEKTDYRLERKVDKTNLEIIQKIRGESEIPVAAASILAKYLFESEVDKLNQKYNIDLRESTPEDFSSDILPNVSKIHFKNVKKFLN